MRYNLLVEREREREKKDEAYVTTGTRRIVVHCDETARVSQLAKLIDPRLRQPLHTTTRPANSQLSANRIFLVDTVSRRVFRDVLFFLD